MIIFFVLKWLGLFAHHFYSSNNIIFDINNYVIPILLLYAFSINYKWVIKTTKAYQPNNKFSHMIYFLKNISQRYHSLYHQTIYHKALLKDNHQKFKIQWNIRHIVMHLSPIYLWLFFKYVLNGLLNSIQLLLF